MTKEEAKEVARTLDNLNNHLFEQLDRLSKEMSAEELAIEVERSKAVVGISMALLESGKLQLKALEYCTEYSELNDGCATKEQIPVVFGLKDKAVGRTDYLVRRNEKEI